MSFVQAENMVQGTHEEIEHNIASKKIPLKMNRDGYDIPSGSEFKFMDYRMKKETIPTFLKNIVHINLKPEGANILELLAIVFVPNKIIKLFGYEKHNFKLVKKDIHKNHWRIGTFPAIVMLLLQFAWFLKPVPVVTPHQNKDERYDNNGWHYTFVIGIIEDADRGFGEEL